MSSTRRMVEADGATYSGSGSGTSTTTSSSSNEARRGSCYTDDTTASASASSSSSPPSWTGVPFSSNPTLPTPESHRASSSGNGNTGGGAGTATGAGTPRWRLPFTLLSSPSSSSPGPAQSKTSSFPSPSMATLRAPPDAVTGSTTNINTGVTGATAATTSSKGIDMDDGSFVETTSAHAALALAQYWNTQVKNRSGGGGAGVGALRPRHAHAQERVQRGRNEAAGDAAQPQLLDDTVGQLQADEPLRLPDGAGSQERNLANTEDYVVVARVENGKKIYRIRPRSRPATGTSSPQKPRGETGQTATSTSALRAPSIRLTRSIPNLRSDSGAGPSTLAPIHRDQDGFYRPPTDSPYGQYLEAPPDSTHHLLPQPSGRHALADSRPRNTSLTTALSIPNLRAERDTVPDGDVFGRLIGWSYSTPPATSAEGVPASSAFQSHLRRAGSSSQTISQQALPLANRPAVPQLDSFHTARTHQTDNLASPAATVFPANDAGAVPAVSQMHEQEGLPSNVTSHFQSTAELPPAKAEAQPVVPYDSRPPDLQTPLANAFPQSFSPNTTPQANSNATPQASLLMQRAATTSRLPNALALGLGTPIGSARPHGPSGTDRSVSHAASSSPFGSGVRLPSSPTRLVRRRKSMGELPNIASSLGQMKDEEDAAATAVGRPDGLPEPVAMSDMEMDAELLAVVQSSFSHLRDDSSRILREVASSETIRTSTYVDESHPALPTAPAMCVVDSDSAPQGHGERDGSGDCSTPLASRIAKASQEGPAPARVPTPVSDIDIRIFDIMQEFELGNCGRQSAMSSRASLGVNETDPRHHQRGMSSTSLASIASLRSVTSVTSNPDRAHEITVTSSPGDDPRFVIWGIKQVPARSQQRQLHQTPSAASSSGNLDSPVSNTSSSAGTSQSGSSRWGNVAKSRRYTFSEPSPSPTAPTSPSLSPSPAQPSPSSTSAKGTSGTKVLMAASVERWIAEMTSKIEVDLMTDFFLTYRAFLTPTALCHLLITRFEWALSASPESAEDIAGRRIVRVRTYVVVRHWLLNYFHEDFLPDRELRTVLTEWLNRLGKDERLRSSPTDLRLVKSLKKVVKKLKAAYSTPGAEAARTAGKPNQQTDGLATGRARAQTASTSASASSADEKVNVLLPPKTLKKQKSRDMLGQQQQQPQRTFGLSASTPASAATGATHLTREKMRTSSSEEDVDLEIDIHASGYDSDERPSFPPVIPISPPRPRTHRSPRIGLTASSNSRSPHLGGSDKSPKLLSALPGMPDNNRLSRYLTSTVGSLGKLKRMMGSKGPGSHAHAPALPYPTEFSRSPGLSASSDSHLPHTGQSASAVARTRYSSQASRQSSQERRQSPDMLTVEQPGLGIYALTASAHETEGAEAVTSVSASPPGLERGPGSANQKRSPPPLHHAASSQTIRRESQADSVRSRNSTRSTRQYTSEDSALLQPAFVQRPASPALSGHDQSRRTIQLDDCDSSDDESSYGGTTNMVRKIRRLPAARDLRAATSGQDRSLSYRHSIDTISSYGLPTVPAIRVPSFSTYDSHDSFANDGDTDGVMNNGDGVVPYFVPMGDDSDDDDEPGDVEAALRRLEGLVDQDKEKSKAKKVELYLKKSEDAKANGGYLPPDAVEARDLETGDEPTGGGALRVVNGARESTDSERGPDNQGQSTSIVISEEPAVASHPVHISDPPAAVESTREGVAVSVPPPEDSRRLSVFGNRKSVQRKSSIRRFFPGSRTSVAARTATPDSTAVPNPRIFALPASSGSSSTHRSFIFDYKTDALAKHFCIIERDLLEKVTWQELVGGEWRHRPEIGEVTGWDAYLKQRARLNASLQTQIAAVGPYGSARSKKVGDVQTIIQRFNLMCNWIASEIVLTTSTVTRALLIAKIIRLAFKCYRVNNFQTVTQLVHGLQSADIERLKRTWNRVPAYEMRLFGQLRFFCSHLRNFRLLREASDSLASQWGPPGQDASAPVELPGVPGVIPFFGLILRDLAVSSELPTLLDPSSPRAPAVINPETGYLFGYSDPSTFAELPPLPADMALRPLVNVHKYRSIAATIQKVMTFKELADCYPYEPELATYRKCLMLTCLSPALISQLSGVCEK